MKKGLIFIVSSIILCMVFGCSKVPSDIISQEKMKEIIVDIHKAEAYMESNFSLFSKKELQDSVKNSIYTKHSITKEDFDNSLTWYSSNLKIFIEVYNKAITTLQEEDNKLLALMNNETNTYVGLTPSGDTVNIWNKENFHIFEGNLNNNLLTFTVPYDDNFKDGDLFKLKFKFYSNEKNIYKPQVILATKEGRDSTRYVQKSIESLGWDSIELKTEGPIKRVIGSIYVPAEPRWKISHLDSITLERIHTR